MNFLQKFRDFVSHPSHSRTLGLLGILAFGGIISLTVIVAQQQQQLKQRASLVCEDTSIQECPDLVKEKGNDCSVNSDFKCKITTGDKYDVYGCQ